MRKFSCSCVLILLLFMAYSSYAGQIRNETISKFKMGKVYLALGRSTILNFDSSPKKVVVGNANYFNIEFTGADLTIQPLRSISSNLFIYTDNYRYGVILKEGNAAQYDDLVYLRWKQPHSFEQESIPLHYPRAFVKNKFDIKFASIKYQKYHDLYIVDFDIINLSQKPILLRNGKIWITRKRKTIPTIDSVSSKKELKYREKGRTRIILRLKKKKGFTAHFKFHQRRAKFIVKKGFL